MPECCVAPLFGGIFRQGILLLPALLEPLPGSLVSLILR
jgi:hypothetical protein